MSMFVTCLLGVGGCGPSRTEFFAAEDPSQEYRVSFLALRRWYLLYEEPTLEVRVQSKSGKEALIWTGIKANGIREPCLPNRVGMLWADGLHILGVRMNCIIGDDFEVLFDLSKWHMLDNPEALRLSEWEPEWRWNEVQLPPKP